MAVMPAKKRPATAPEPFRIPRDKVLTAGRFFTDFHDIDQACHDERFCFIVGSGASHPIIPSGARLVDRWLVELHDMDCPDSERLRPPHANLADFAGALLPAEEGRLRTWAERTFADLPGFQWKSRAEHYGRIYQRRFISRPHIGQEFLRELMHGKPPALGHHLLGRLLARTRHHVVITTNFDRLVEDAVAITERIAVQSFGSKDLAQYLEREQRGPVVAKIHGDLQLETYNTLDDILTLREQWSAALEALLKRYTPIVTGYGGNDPGFMRFLCETLPKVMGNRHLYWVLRSKNKPIENPHLQELAGLDCVRFIEGLDFTELMVRLNDCQNFPPLDEELKQRAEAIAAALKTATAEAREKLISRSAPSELETAPASADPAAPFIPATNRTWRDWCDVLYYAPTTPARHAVLAEARLAFPCHPVLEAAALRLDALVSPSDPKWKPQVEEYLKRAEAEFGSEAPETLFCLTILADVISDQGDFAGAEPLYRRALETRERILGPEHPDTLSSVNNLAILLHDQGDLAGAETLYRRALEGRERIHGPEQLDTLYTVNSLAILLSDQGDLTGAEPLYRRALEGREGILGAEHPDTLICVNNLGTLREEQGRLEEAAALYARVVAWAQAHLLPEHSYRKIYERNLARVRKQLGK